MDNKKIYVTGHRGFVGSTLIDLGCSPLLSDIEDSVELDKEIARVRPEIIVHCAAKSSVNWCEENPQEAHNTNFVGTVNVFEFAQKYDIPVVYISSDHIFSGDKLGSYKEDSEDIPPKNVYGMLKFSTDGVAYAFDNVKVVRTSTLISAYRPEIEQYVHSLLEGETVHPPVFIWRSFMHVKHFAKSLIVYAHRFKEMPKVLNISGSKNVSWWGLIMSYAIAYGFDQSKVRMRFRSSGDKSLAKRPYRAGLNTSLSKKLGLSQYDYKDAIREDL